MSDVRTVPVTRNPRIQGGDLIFAGTRVPVRRLFEYLETGESLGTFLEHFPTVERQQAVDTLVLLRQKLLDEVG